MLLLLFFLFSKRVSKYSVAGASLTKGINEELFFVAVSKSDASLEKPACGLARQSILCTWAERAQKRRASEVPRSTK